jgi:hypothetical protein
MSDGSWDDVLSGYKTAQNVNGYEDFVWMEKFVAHLLANRDLSKLYPITSHQRLIVFIGESFELVYNKPVITIQLSHEVRESIKDKFRFKISLTSGREDGELFRENAETVYCSFEKSLEVFDEMFAKLEKK